MGAAEGAAEGEGAVEGAAEGAAEGEGGAGCMAIETIGEPMAASSPLCRSWWASLALLLPWASWLA